MCIVFLHLFGPMHKGMFTALLPSPFPQTVGSSGSQNATSLLPEAEFPEIPLKVNQQGLRS